MEIRRFISQGMEAGSFVPTGAAAVYARERDCGRELAGRSAWSLPYSSRLRMLDRTAFDAPAGRLRRRGCAWDEAARTQPSLNAVLAAAKTKRYAMSRVRHVQCRARRARGDEYRHAAVYPRACRERARLRAAAADERPGGRASRRDKARLREKSVRGSRNACSPSAHPRTTCMCSVTGRKGSERGRRLAKQPQNCE